MYLPKDEKEASQLPVINLTLFENNKNVTVSRYLSIMHMTKKIITSMSFSMEMLHKSSTND